MRIVDFTSGHIGQAIGIARRNYEAERERVPALPPVTDWPDMSCFVQNHLGAAAFDGDTMLGFLCVWNPWDGAWSMPGLRHVFSPMHGNGTVAENRAKIYARLYQAAGEKWARAGAASHGVCLYAHDTAGQGQFFRCGFGMRTVDAIRAMDDIAAPPCEGYTFPEPAPEDAAEILLLDHMLGDGMIESPTFMRNEQSSEDEFLANYHHSKSVYSIARHNGRMAAFIMAEYDGENFVKDTPGYLHVNGMYCLPEHRGTGLSQKLLNLLVQKLKAAGYTRLGVDFESINPAGSGFWLKHFTAYTHGVVRRIDDGAVV